MIGLTTFKTSVLKQILYFCTLDFHTLIDRKPLLLLVLAATPLEASSGTLNVWFFGSSLYDTYLCCVEISMRKNPGKDNKIGSAVSEILWYKHTNTQTHIQTSCYFIIRI